MRQNTIVKRRGPYVPVRYANGSVPGAQYAGNNASSIANAAIAHHLTYTVTLDRVLWDPGGGKGDKVGNFRVCIVGPDHDGWTEFASRLNWTWCLCVQIKLPTFDSIIQHFPSATIGELNFPNSFKHFPVRSAAANKELLFVEHKTSLTIAASNHVDESAGNRKIRAAKTNPRHRQPSQSFGVYWLLTEDCSPGQYFPRSRTLFLSVSDANPESLESTFE
ncbi:unnamed protein product [Leptosia nina]|uniref:Uncharacterized protein n=1 Tax=Leptosia nina TaxID=320188 RepID=A0AAV1J7A9_9NEOP